MKGKSVAVDTSGWLHKGLYVCAEDFVDSGYVDNQLYVDFILSRVKTFEANGVKLILVFDGKRNNLKGDTQRKREDSRTRYLEQGYRLVDNMRSAVDGVTRSKLRQEAIACFQRGMAVSHEMENSVISAARKMGVQVIVSPNESDAQLAHLCKINYCQGVLTEDSDILVYSAVCGTPFPIFYKYDSKSNLIQELNLKSVGILGAKQSIAVISSDTIGHNDSVGSKSQYKCDDVSFFDNTVVVTHQQQVRQSILSNDNWTSSEKNFVKQLGHFQGNNGRRLFVQMCVLAGCDYSESIQGVGLITAQGAVVKFKDIPDDVRIERICKWFRANGRNVPESYRERAVRAEALFFYQPVYSPISKTIVNFMSPRLDSGVINADNSDGSLVLPVISNDELSRLGGEKQVLNGAPGAEVGTTPVSIRDVCEGLICYQTFMLINPRYPWDSKQVKNTSSSSGWAIRKKLMSVLGYGGGSNVTPFGNSTGVQKRDGKSGHEISSKQFAPKQPKQITSYSKQEGPNSNYVNKEAFICRPYKSQVSNDDSNKAYSKYFNAPTKVQSTSTISPSSSTVITSKTFVPTVTVSPNIEFIYDIEDESPEVKVVAINHSVNTVTPDLESNITNSNSLKSVSAMTSPTAGLTTLETFAYEHAHSTTKNSIQFKGGSSVANANNDKENNGVISNLLLGKRKQPIEVLKNVNSKKQKAKSSTASSFKSNTITRYLK